MSPQPRIAVVGSANVDLTVFTDAMPRPGETIFGRRFDLGFGGKGANQAVAARLCGAEVTMVARVGQDLFGPATIRNFRGFGIDTAHVIALEGVSSGVAPIFVDPAGENRIIVVKGANDALTPADVDEAAAVLERADCIVLQFEVPLPTVVYTIHFATERGIRCILNPAPGQPVDLERLAHLDYLVPNETEAEALTGMPIRGVDDARRCASTLLDTGIRRVILTMGAGGALVAGPDGIDHVPAFQVEAVDTTGAGDAYRAGFYAGLHRKLPLERCGLAGAAAASFAVEAKGPQTSIPTWGMVEGRMRDG